MFVTPGVQLVAIGAILGLVGAFLLTRFLRTLLFEIQPMDPVTLLLVGAQERLAPADASLLIEDLRLVVVASWRHDVPTS